MSEATVMRPFDADCGRCANVAADKLPDDDPHKHARRMYLCPECGNKRCRKAADHEISCDKGEHAEAARLRQDALSAGMRVGAAQRALREFVMRADASPVDTWGGPGGIRELATATLEHFSCDPDAVPQAAVDNLAPLDIDRLRRFVHGYGREMHEAECVLAEALGLPVYPPGSPGYSPDMVNYVTGDHTIVTLADAVARALRESQGSASTQCSAAEVDQAVPTLDAEAKLRRVRQEIEEYLGSLDDHITMDDFAEALRSLRSILDGGEP